MPKKALQVNMTTGAVERTPDLVESSEVQTVSTLNAIPRADSAGKLDEGWIGTVPFTALPVASDGENSTVKVVRADDARLNNPPVGGDLSGTAQAATVVRLQGRDVANTAPNNGQGLVWNHANNRWEPAAVGGDAGNATQIQGRDVAATAPTTGDVLVWNGTAWEPTAGGGGGGGSTEEHVRIAASLWLHERGPFG